MKLHQCLPAVLFFSLLQPVFALAEADSPTPRVDRFASISTGYLDTAFHSNDGLSEFPLSFMTGYGFLYDQVFENWASTPGKRGLAFLMSFPISVWTSDALYLGFHEFGHGRAANALGINYSYGNPFYNQAGISNYWSLSISLFGSVPGIFSDEDPPYTQATAAPVTPAGASGYFGASGGNVIFAAGGINNSTFLANKIGQRIYTSGGHVTQWTYYFTEKLDGLLYAVWSDPARLSNDISALVSFYQNKGYAITSDTIARFYSLGLLSGTSLSLFKGLFDYFSTGDPTVRPLEWKGIRFPEISSYLNARGISLELQSGYRYSKNLLFGLGYEWIAIGDFTSQLTPKVEFDLASVFPSLNQFWVSFEGMIGAGFGHTLEAHWMPYQDGASFFKNLSYGLKFYQFNRQTLYGERNSPDLQSDNTLQLMASVRFHY